MRGILPGSFLDVLCQGHHKGSGEALSDVEITQQAWLHLHCGCSVAASALHTVYVPQELG